MRPARLVRKAAPESALVQRQFAGWVLAVASVVLVWRILAPTPMHARLATVPVAQLRSQAVEIELLQRDVMVGRVPVRFERVQLVPGEESGEKEKNGTERTGTDLFLRQE